MANVTVPFHVPAKSPSSGVAIGLDVAQFAKNKPEIAITLFMVRTEKDSPDRFRKRGGIGVRLEQSKLEDPYSRNFDSSSRSNVRKNYPVTGDTALSLAESHDCQLIVLGECHRRALVVDSHRIATNKFDLRAFKCP